MQDEQLQSLKSVTNVIYGLQALSFLFGFTAIVGVVVNYIKQGDVQGTWLASHFRWQIRTFWFGLLWMVIGTVLAPIGVGFLILAAAAVWFIYRIVRGWLRLMDGSEMYAW
ncbi:MAG: hypothetical protein EA349_11455 [Halomonadaceae bacterium]|nr:MAG: hypothetical protein EA349_11455 [Halomonadaceae bacterium]